MAHSTKWNIQSKYNGAAMIHEQFNCNRHGTETKLKDNIQSIYHICHSALNNTHAVNCLEKQGRGYSFSGRLQSSGGTLEQHAPARQVHNSGDQTVVLFCVGFGRGGELLLLEALEGA
jgi:hypothetical protein